MNSHSVPLKRLVDARRPITYGIVQAGPDVPNGIPYIRPVDMTATSGVADPAALQRTAPEIATVYRRSMIEKGDIVLSIGPSFGKVMITPEVLAGANLTQGTARIAPARFVDVRYLYWALQSAPVRQFWDSVTGGATFRALNLEPLGNTPVPWAPADEQRRIADFLDIEMARIERLTALRQSMHELLAQKRARIIEEALGLSEAPERVTFIALRHLVHEITVGIVVTPAAWYVQNAQEGVPALRGVNVRPGRIVYDDVVRISRRGHALHRKSQLQRGDLVVVRTGQAGAAAVVPRELEGANCIDLLLIRPGSELCSRYVEYVLNSDYTRRHINEHTVGTIQSHLNVGAIKRIPIPMVPLKEQQRHVEALDRRIEPIDELLTKLKHQENALAERKQALITASVTGEMDVTTAQRVDVS